MLKNPQLWRVVALSVVLALAISAKEPHQFQQGTLLGFETIRTGKTCRSSGDIDGKVNDSGDISATTESRTRCQDQVERHYQVEIAGHIYTLSAAASLKSLIPSSGLWLRSSLFGQPVGTHVPVFTNGKAVWIKNGNKETKFEIVAVR